MHHTIHLFHKSKSGSPVIIKKSIEQIEDSRIHLESIQVISVRVPTKSKIFNESAIYCPPQHNLQNNTYLNLFRSLSNNFIIQVILIVSILIEAQNWLILRRHAAKNIQSHFHYSESHQT